MGDGLSEIIVEFIRTQESADRISAQCASGLQGEEATLCRKNFRRLQKKADRLLGKYLTMKRMGRPSQDKPSVDGK